MTIVVLSFNHAPNVAPMFRALRQLAGAEVIVCEDGSVDGARRAWARRLTGANEFMLLSNDLHEIRVYDRALRMARAPVVALFQDDDIPADDPAWFDDVLAAFADFDDLAVVGACSAFGDFQFDDESGHLSNDYGTDRLVRRAGRAPLAFVEMVNVGPLFLRRDAILSLGGLDLDYSAPGQLGIHFDHDVSLRAWRAGYSVGWLPLPITRHVGGAGTFIFSPSADRVAHAHHNRQRLVDDHAASLPEVQARVASRQTALERAGGPDQPVAARIADS